MLLFENRAATVLYNVLINIPHDNFLLPLNICPIVPDTFIRANKKFTFVDISLRTLCMDEQIALKTIQNNNTIKGVLFVKTFGIEFDVEPFYKQIKELNNDIFIIDDMCPCLQEFDCNIDNTYADMKLFSSGYSKYIDIGYGGYAFVKKRKSFNIFTDNNTNKEFLSYKNEILSKIEIMKQHKDELNKIYYNNIDKKYHLGNTWNNWRFSIMVNNKKEILDEIFKQEGLFASSHYPQVDYNYVHNPIQNSNTHKIHKSIINLFNDFRYTKEKAYETIDIINKGLRNEY